MRRTLLDDATALEDREAVRESGRDREVVADQHERHAVRRDEAGEQVEDLRLGRHVERGGRLVRDQQTRRQRDSHGDRDALALAARQFVRIAPERHAIGLETDALQRGRGEPARRRAGQGAVNAPRLGNLLPDCHQRIERGRRLLEHDPDAAPANAAELALAGAHELGALEAHAAAHRSAVRQEASDGERRHRLTGARLATQPEDLAALGVELDRVEDATVADRDRQAAQ